MRRILIMASLFPPQTLGGGPIVSIYNLVSTIKDTFEVFVISQNFELKSTAPLKGVIKHTWNDKFGIKVYYVSPEERTFKKIYSLICEISPDIIYQNSFFSADQMVPVLYYKKRHKNVHCIVAPRGELGTEKLNKGKAKKYVYIKLLSAFGMLRNVMWHATSISEKEDIKRVFNRNAIRVIPNLPSQYSNPTFDIDKKTGELRLFSISRIQRIKNITASLECLRNVSGNITYDIFGPIEENDYWKECKTIIKELPNNITVNYKGKIDHSVVEETIKRYHALVSPTRGENFGQTIVDSFLNGRPVIISNMTPWSDCDKEAGIVIQLDDIIGLTNAVQFFTDMSGREYDLWMRRAYAYINRKIDYSVIVSKYKRLFEGQK